MGKGKALNLVGALAIQCCNGGLYAWSIFVPALRADYDLSSTQLAMVFSATMAFFTATMVVVGPIQERHGPRGLLLLAGTLFAAGHLAAARSDGGFLALLVGLGILGGTAIGLGYVTALSVCAKSFPRRCGLATGVVVAGFGASSVVISQVATAELARGLDVLELLGRVGAVYAVVVAGSGFILSPPNAPLCPAEPSSTQTRTSALADPRTHALLVGMFAGTFGGLLVVSHLHPLVLNAGSSPQFATWAVGAFALGNAMGRVLWGQLADRAGRATITASLVCLIAALLLLSAATSPKALIGASAFLGLCFGAAFVVYAAQVVRDHGPSGLGLVYPWVFLSYGLAGIAGPVIGGWLADAMGDYRYATLLAAGVAAIGVPASEWLRRRGQSWAQQPTTTHAA